jgi:predicted DsbA family dithiol-disulfide isomerase
MKSVPIIHFSDVLCIWAYIAQLRVNAIKAAYGREAPFDYRFCNIFGDTVRKIPAAWKDQGGYAGFNRHLCDVARSFPEIVVNPDIWLTVRPASSASPHVFLKAVQIGEAEDVFKAGAFEQALRIMRLAFFERGFDISCWDVQCAVGEEAGIDSQKVKRLIDNGRAFAALASDYQDADAMKIQGSPTFLLNEGRQKLYGNVGYRIIDANIQELLREPNSGQASWC